VTLHPVKVDSAIAMVGPNTAPDSLGAALSGVQVVQFDRPLPESLLVELRSRLRDAPDVTLRVYGRELDPSLGFLNGFEYVRGLSVEMWHVESFEPLRSFTELTALGLGETRSTRPSLRVVQSMPRLKRLWIEAHAREFDAVGDLPLLSSLSLRVPRVKSLNGLREHPALEGFSCSFGVIRDFQPLGTLPRLRCLSLHQIRGLECAHLVPLGAAPRLQALELLDLRRVTSLTAFGASPPIRFLRLEGLRALESLAPLAGWPHLTHLEITRSCPADGRLTPLLECRSLEELIVNDRFPAEDIPAFGAHFRGHTFRYIGEYVKGIARGPLWFWDRVAQANGERAPLGHRFWF
jgi:hypothetical protein